MCTHLTSRKTINHVNMSISDALCRVKFVLVLVAVLLLSACGNKGDLYLPDKNDTKQQTSQATKPNQP